MTPGMRFNFIVMSIGALGGVSFSFVDPSFLDSESYLIIKTLLGGAFFTTFICYLLDVDRDCVHKIDLNHYVFDFTKPFNSFFVIGVTLMLSGIVCFFVMIFSSKQFMIPSYLVMFGLSQIAGALLYTVLSNVIRGKNRRNRRGHP
jgi:hypothetical protein